MPAAGAHDLSTCGHSYGYESQRGRGGAERWTAPTDSQGTDSGPAGDYFWWRSSTDTSEADQSSKDLFQDAYRIL